MARSGLVSISVGYPNLFSVKLTNTQNTDTPSPFQQMLQLPVSQLQSYTPILASDFHNVRFVYNGTGIPAWLESINNGVATIWVNIPVSIPANSSITIDMEVDPSLNFDGVYWGEAPQLSPTYGEYDDGANVFNFYDNFAGTSLNTSKWTSGTNSGGTVTVNNGLTLTYNSSSAGGAWVASTYAFTQSSNTIWETNFNLYGTSDFSDVRVRFYFWDSADAVSGDSNAYSWLYLVASKDYGYYTSSDIGANIANVMLPFGTILGTLPTPSSSTDYNALSQQILTTSGFTFNTYSFPSYSSVGSATQSGSSSATFQLVLEASDDGSPGNTVQVNVDWTRTRAYPPNGVMPTVEVIP